MAEIKNFGKARKSLQFDVDEDRFEAVPVVPAEVMIEFAEGFTTMDPTAMSPREMVGALRKVIEFVLMPESLTRFKARMRDPLNPIGMDQLDEIVQWLFEEYGLRPTGESSSSSNGDSLPEPGTTSTVSMPEEVLTSGPFPSISS